MTGGSVELFLKHHAWILGTGAENDGCGMWDLPTLFLKDADCRPGYEGFHASPIIKKRPDNPSPETAIWS